MDRVQQYLMIAIVVISGLLFYLSCLGLELTHKLFYLVPLGCCLYTLLFTAYHLRKPNRQPIVVTPEIHVVVVQFSESEPDPLLVKVMDRM